MINSYDSWNKFRFLPFDLLLPLDKDLEADLEAERGIECWETLEPSMGLRTDMLYVGGF